MREIKRLFPLLPLLSFLAVCATPPSAPPAWVESAEAVYPRAVYVSATGYAGDRNTAEKNAFAALVSYFGQNIQADSTAVSSYREALSNGVIDSWTETSEMKNTIKTSSAFDNLIGAEIKETWKDPQGTYYAVAVLEKATAAMMYAELIRANFNIIRDMTAMTPAVENSLDGVIRYRAAANIADVNVYYATIIRLLDAVPPDGVTAGDRYRLEAQRVIKTIPIGIRITQDRQGRIFGAFAKCLSDFGFDSGSGVLGGAASGPRYVLNVGISLQPVELPGNTNKFARIEVDANLTDSVENKVLLPYNVNSREGHLTQAEAENRSFSAAERKINEEYPDLLSEYLSTLIPKK
jgi:hypothetical protein